MNRRAFLLTLPILVASTAGAEEKKPKEEKEEKPKPKPKEGDRKAER